jgi:hypothetical protein
MITYDPKDLRILARAIARVKGERAFRQYLAKMDTFVYANGRRAGRQCKHVKAMSHRPGSIIPYPLFAFRNFSVALEFKRLSKKESRNG